MNLFSFFVKLNHRQAGTNWCEANAVFTGKVESAPRKKIANCFVYSKEYEIRYNVDGKEYRGYHCFYPLPDPDEEEIKDTQIRIRYHTKKPFVFEQVIDDETTE